MSDQPPPIERHEAYDRFGKASLRMAHDITAALAESGRPEGDQPIVVRTDGRHRSLDELATLIDEVLEQEGSEAPSAARPSTP